MTTRIRILGDSPDPIRQAPMPLDQSLEWVSSHEHLVDARTEIFFAQSAYSSCVEHTASDLENEVGGLLVGEMRVDPESTRPYILIEHLLPALHTESGQTFVTFTQQSLVKLHGELENQFPGKRIVGWYHTHPRLGVFMSSYDTWLHDNFFNDPNQVALVVDPFHERGGFFCWQKNRRLDPIHYVGFYEWGNVGDESIMLWNNLEPVSTETETETEPAAEEHGSA